ncbi:hypothetical protein ABIQ69_10725 [Agromyces sp. G08B096]|uniref:4'-phosphopantetheinyl transferase superfamily protein n=1 Tax=Agromyces sp. G08B096 TaxID=3156399 RepID=A0AAU7W4H9_9MICO
MQSLEPATSPDRPAAAAADTGAPGAGAPGALAAGGRTWRIEWAQLSVARLVADRRPPAAEQVLAGLIARTAGVPVGDVELERRCGECGARHGVPAVEYPTTPSGARWRGDAAASSGLVVAAVGMRHRLGVAVQAPGPEGAAVDEAAFHPGERARLDAVDPAERRPLRAMMWARKAALSRALGHRTFLEPARIELGEPDAGGAVRLVRGVPEFGASWRDVIVIDLPGDGDGVAAAVALLP